MKWRFQGGIVKISGAVFAGPGAVLAGPGAVFAGRVFRGQGSSEDGASFVEGVFFVDPCRWHVYSCFQPGYQLERLELEVRRSACRA